MLSLRTDVRPDGVAVITLGASDWRFKREARDALGEALRSTFEDAFIRAIVLISGHSQTFLVSDIGELQSLEMRGHALEEVASRHRLADLFLGTEKPIVAAVHGRASGLGFEVALACAARIVSDDPHTVLELSDVALGIAPSFQGLCRLADLVGYEPALRVAIFGTPLDAREAAALGIAQEIVPRGQLVERAARHAAELAHGTAPARARIAPASAFSTTRLGKRVLMARAKRSVVRELGRDAAAPAHMIAILEAHARGGAKASRLVEREAFAQLVIASGTKRRLDVAFAIDDLLSDTFHHGSVIEKTALADEERARSTPPTPRDSTGEKTTSIGLSEIFIDFDNPPKIVSRSVAGNHARGHAVIVVRHEPLGFLRRIACVYINEACWLLSGGSTIQHVDSALVAWGFSVGPLTLCDSLGARNIVSDCLALEGRSGSRFAPSPFLRLLADDAGGGGRPLYRAVGNSSPVSRWRQMVDGPRLSRAHSVVDGAALERLGMAFPDASAPPLVAREEAQMRCALLMVNEALHCLHEEVISSTRDGNVASVLGLGFPTFRGGVFGYVDTLGPRELKARLAAFTRHVGDRFEPAPLLDELIDAESRGHATTSSRI